MSTECRHRERCTVTHTPAPKLEQTTLAVRDGRLSYARLPKPPYKRTPAPNAVRRIANTPIFTTTNPSLTSFLRFPPELRIAIYRLLLRRDKSAYTNYPICSTVRRFVAPHAWYPTESPPWMRHELFPAILECCRTTHREGSEVLYGENQFSLGCFAASDYHTWRTANSWPLGDRYLQHITRLRFAWYGPEEAESLSAQLAIFSNVRHLSVHRDMSGEQWTEYLRQNMDVLQRIPRAEFHITVSESQVRGLYAVQPSREAPVDPKAACERLYLEELKRNTALMNGRRLAWTFADLTDEGDYGDRNWHINFFVG